MGSVNKPPPQPISKILRFFRGWLFDFILKCSKEKVSKIIVITGKGSRSKNFSDPYQSFDLSILKYSVPEYINSNSELLKVIKSINQQDIDSVSRGSFEILLKKKL